MNPYILILILVFLRFSISQKFPYEIYEEMDLPDSLDYRTKGVVTPVKSQRQCNSCWAFSATGALESHYALKTGVLLSLSEQQLMDCSVPWHNQACDGGSAQYAFQYVHDAMGIESNESYPYIGRRDSCNFHTSRAVMTCQGFRDLPKGDELLLQKALIAYGPVAVAFEATKNFQLYRSGVLDDPTCSDRLSHAGLLVGYGTESGKDFWLVKTSEGPNFGENGYIKMSRGKDNQCGIASSPVVPIV